VVSLFAFAGPASAASIHISAGSLGAATSTPPDPYPLGGPTAVAVDDSAGPSAHDLYVTDPAHFRIEKFDPEGHLILMFGKEVNKTKTEASAPEAEQNVCVIASLDECQSGVQGSGGKGQFSDPAFLAVDSSTGLSAGDVYVADTGTDVVYKFSSEGAFLAENDGEGAGEGHFSGLDGVAVGTGGNVSILDRLNGPQIFRFDQAGTFVPPPFQTGGTGAESLGLSIDGAGAFYLVGFSTEKYDSSGKNLGRVLPAPFEGGSPSTGLTADQLTNDLYVDTGLEIEHVAPSCDPSKGLCQIADVFGSSHLVEGEGLGIDQATNTVYAADASTGTVQRFAVGLEAATAAATAVGTNGATLEGTVDPEGSTVTECVFEYGTTTEYGHSAPCEETVGGGTSAVPVHAPVEGLAGGATYHYRIFARNGAGAVVGEDAEFTTLTTPRIESAEAKEVTAGSATLAARINPRGIAARYRFEYGTTTAYGQSTPEVSIGSGTTGVSVSQVISGLAPDTTYHFRVVVNGTIAGEDHTFVFLTAPQLESGCDEALRTGPSAHLPDCRGYEMVTPPQKNGALLGAGFPGLTHVQIAADGSRLAINSIQCFGDASSCVAAREGTGTVFEFTRASGAWQTQSLSPSASAFQTTTWQSFGGLPGTLLFRAPAGPSSPDVIYVSRQGKIERVGPFGEGPVTANLVNGVPPAQLSSTDPPTILFDTTAPIWSFEPGESGEALYQYRRTEEPRPELVGVSGGPGSDDLISACRTTLTGNGGASAATFGSLSTDGRVVYFMAGPCATGTGVNVGHAVPALELYERIDGARTVQISIGTSENCSAACQGVAPRDAVFEGASTDGTRAFFTSTQQLTDEASQDNNPGDSASGARAHGCAQTSSSASGCNLYLSECPDQCANPSQRHLIDVSAGAQDSGGPRVQGVTAISPDGSHVYFVAKGILTTGMNKTGLRAVLGGDNLYAYTRDEADPGGGKLSFIATLTPSDERTNWYSTNQGIGGPNVTRDGRYLVFTSHRGLTAEARQGEGPAQVYRYDAATDQLIRISVGQGGFDDNGNGGSAIADAGIVESFRAYELGGGPARANPTMSDDGRYVFFQSPVALTPGALDEVPTGGTIGEGPNAHPELAQNVYEWEQQGAGDCTEPQGCVSLISDGTDVSESGKISITPTELLGTDESGEDVFFATNSRLIAKDTDTQRDYYDARVGGGEAAPVEPTACEGDACKGQGTSAAAGAAAATPNVNAPSEGPNNRRGGTKCQKKKSKSKHGSGCQKKPKHPKKKHHKKQKAGHGKKDGHGHKKSKGENHHPGGKGD
jgi:hypothetical protein